MRERKTRTLKIKSKRKTFVFESGKLQNPSVSYNRRHCLEWHIKNDLLFIVTEFFAKCLFQLARSPLSCVGFFASVQHAFESFQCEHGCYIFPGVFPILVRILWEIFINHLSLEHMYVLTELPIMHLTLAVNGLFSSVNLFFTDPYEIFALNLSHPQIHILVCLIGREFCLEGTNEM